MPKRGFHPLKQERKVSFLSSEGKSEKRNVGWDILEDKASEANLSSPDLYNIEENLEQGSGTPEAEKCDEPEDAAAETLPEEVVARKSLDSSVFKKNRKILFAIVGILLLAVLTGATIGTTIVLSQRFLTQEVPPEKSPEEIAVLKALELLERRRVLPPNLRPPVVPEIVGERDTSYSVHENADYGLSFKYPSHWVEVPQFRESPQTQNVSNLVMLADNTKPGFLKNMRVVVERTPLSLTAKDYIRETEDRMKEIFPFFQKVREKEVTVSGREAPARVYMWVPDTESSLSPHPEEWRRIKQYQVYIADGQSMFVITFTSWMQDFEDDFDSFQNVLKSMQIRR